MNRAFRTYTVSTANDKPIYLYPTTLRQHNEHTHINIEQIMTDFKYSFVVRFSKKFAIKPSPCFPPQLTYVAALSIGS